MCFRLNVCPFVIIKCFLVSFLRFACLYVSRMAIATCHIYCNSFHLSNQSMCLDMIQITQCMYVRFLWWRVAMSSPRNYAKSIINKKNYISIPNYSEDLKTKRKKFIWSFKFYFTKKPTKNFFKILFEMNIIFASKRYQMKRFIAIFIKAITFFFSFWHMSMWFFAIWRR